MVQKSYIYVCTGCGKKEKDIGFKTKDCGVNVFDRLSNMLENVQNIEVLEAPCLSNCNRGVSVALTAKDKYHWLFGDKSTYQDDLDAIISAAQAHTSLSDGFLEKPDRAMPVIARIPPIK